MCKNALEYSNNDLNIALAYIKAKTLPILTSSLSFEERVRYFMNIKEIEGIAREDK